MKSEIQVDLRTQYCTMLFKRSDQEQILIRQRMIRYAQIHGIKPAARHYGCSKNTVKTWLRRFEKGGTKELKNQSRAPHYCPHKTSKEVEEQVIAKRQ
ncbi:MAG TPA: helix-turn-helix domain-containing protein [Chlamydiales bacterium]|nr:helix-turn-helix domain-containing protein [Chlamydiales bacterium]